MLRELQRAQQQLAPQVVEFELEQAPQQQVPVQGLQQVPQPQELMLKQRHRR
jgi:hypothetical protein